MGKRISTKTYSNHHISLQKGEIILLNLETGVLAFLNSIKKYPMEILKTNKQNISNEDKPKENYNEAHNQTA